MRNIRPRAVAETRLTFFGLTPEKTSRPPRTGCLSSDRRS
jgi:hypothetical protein